MQRHSRTYSVVHTLVNPIEETGDSGESIGSVSPESMLLTENNPEQGMSLQPCLKPFHISPTEPAESPLDFHEQSCNSRLGSKPNEEESILQTEEESGSVYGAGARQEMVTNQGWHAVGLESELFRSAEAAQKGAMGTHGHPFADIL